VVKQYNYVRIFNEMTMQYRIFLRHEPEGSYTVIVPALAGCLTSGDTIEEALQMAQEAIELYIETLIADGEPIPQEESVTEYTLAFEGVA
jgi:antitoxin HicB